MARFTTVVAVVVVASAYMGSAQSTPHAVSTTAVFTAGEGGYDAFRIPGIAAYRGVILVFAEGRKYVRARWFDGVNLLYCVASDRAPFNRGAVTLRGNTTLFSSGAQTVGRRLDPSACWPTPGSCGHRSARLSTPPARQCRVNSGIPRP